MFFYAFATFLYVNWNIEIRYEIELNDGFM